MLLKIMCAILLALAIPATVLAQPSASGAPVVVGQSHVLQSAVLGEPRTVNIYVPATYGTGRQSYPVLFLLDGGAAQDFHHISGLSQLASVNGSTQELIVVGIETRDRRRELAFSAVDPRYTQQWPSHGHSADLRQFIAQELVPFVRQKWPASGETVLMGESLAGLFVIETLLREPTLFDHYIAVDPSMWWDNGVLARLAPDLLRRADLSGHSLWLATAAPQSATEQLIETLQNDAPALRLTVSRRPQETHATIYHPAALDALRALYSVSPGPDGPCPWWFCDNPAAQPPSTSR